MMWVYGTQGPAGVTRPAVGTLHLRRDDLILLDQMRTLDKQRLVRRLGGVTASTLRQTLAVLREMFEE